MKKALITGVAGQDGSYMADYLLRNGYKVYGLSRHHGDPQKNWRISHLFTNKNFSLLTGDITDPASISFILESIQPKELYHFAAQSFVGRSWQDARMTFETNVLGTLNVLEAVLMRSPKTKILHASSSEMFGLSPHPQNEKTPFHPVSPYGVSKVAAHHLAVNYRESHGLFVACSIAFNHESPRRGGAFVTKKIISAYVRAHVTKQEQKLELGNVMALRDWGHAKDYVVAMWKMLQRSEPEDFVIGTGKTYSVADFIKICNKILPDAGLVIVKTGVPEFMRPVDDFVLHADPKKINEKLAWSPVNNLEDLITDMFETEKSETLEKCRTRS